MVVSRQHNEGKGASVKADKMEKLDFVNIKNDRFLIRS